MSCESKMASQNTQRKNWQAYNTRQRKKVLDRYHAICSKRGQKISSA